VVAEVKGRLQVKAKL